MMFDRPEMAGGVKERAQDQLGLLLNAFVRGSVRHLSLLRAVVIDGETVSEASRRCGMSRSAAVELVERWNEWSSAKAKTATDGEGA